MLLRKTCGLALMATSFSVFAALGQAPLQVPAIASLPQASGVKRQISVVTNGNATYTESTVMLQNGVKVQEFVSMQGIVFALKWSGSTIPDFGILFADFYPEYRAAVQRHSGGGFRRSLAVQSEGLVAAASGYLHAFSGYAYAPLMVPAGVDINALVK